MKKSSIGIFRNSRNVKLNLVPVMGKSAIRGAAALGCEAINNTLTNAINKAKPGKLSRIVAPGMALLGIAGELFIQNQYLSAVAQGISSESIRILGHQYIPSGIKSKMNLSGLSYNLQNRRTSQSDVSEANNELLAQELRNRGSNNQRTSTDNLNGLTD